jgi:hypothetical protein
VRKVEVPVAVVGHYHMLRTLVLVSDLLDVHVRGEDIDVQQARGESNVACAQVGVMFDKLIAFRIHRKEIIKSK